MSAPPKPTFFRAPAHFRRWLERNHAKVAELWVGFRKKGSGRPSITWPEAVGVYSFERKTAELSGGLEAQFKVNRKAWEFFRSQAPSYQRVATWWVVSAKKEETRQSRLATLIAQCAAGRRLGP